MRKAFAISNEWIFALTAVCFEMWVRSLLILMDFSSPFLSREEIVGIRRQLQYNLIAGQMWVSSQMDWNHMRGRGENRDLVPYDPALATVIIFPYPILAPTDPAHATMVSLITVLYHISALQKRWSCNQELEWNCDLRVPIRIGWTAMRQSHQVRQWYGISACPSIDNWLF